jgi:hypothetical protein
MCLCSSAFVTDQYVMNYKSTLPFEELIKKNTYVHFGGELSSDYTTLREKHIYFI